MKNYKCDILVVGGGPAGSNAARYAAKGADVIIIEKKKEIGGPVQCAEGVSQGLFEKLEMKQSDRYVSTNIEFVKLISPNGTVIRLDGERVKYWKSGMILDREVFDKAIAKEAARNGADFLMKTRFVSAKRNSSGVTVKAKQMNEDIQIDAKVVIGADGPPSIVAKSLGMDTTVPLRYLESGIQYLMTPMEIEPCIELYFGDCYAPGGYSWVFPKGDDQANVGLGVLPVKAKQTAQYYLDKFIERPRFKKAKIVEVNGGAIPVNGPLKEPYMDNLLLAGDAGRFVNPLTGGGIHTAIITGKHAGELAAEAIAKEDYSANFLKKYNDMWKPDIYDELDKCLKAQEAFMKLNEKDLDAIAETLKDLKLETISTISVLKAIVAKNPGLLLKLGKFM
ncbi:MAG: Digeranylgeranylglycerophospholipid reductase [Candidatus Methanofastidiosum methylothiophilum]|uniref:Digeranylgeranylglycerophospholipid reductase n=1 Tax=Candidatus Methanofastidiosum methylothiophilum TaxID=1705564 RepID=A0A150IV08_9EURY|nr:MAG: Digeranylgeranylglycerophospholipid reductase [Candidatus Methanofastidiosum methylthiophilus]KYC48695.1 MAG: Digeranylgeranylglycerophospholipid reductase [Candidatus Methanofastidiosum methylthiophilus]KYC51343.1 MAG: Digeranylgeranylglycerophospholipid reductase [Candidatus Methanofastidiosum methylthiophilus]